MQMTTLRPIPRGVGAKRAQIEPELAEARVEYGDPERRADARSHKAVPHAIGQRHRLQKEDERIAGGSADCHRPGHGPIVDRTVNVARSEDRSFKTWGRHRGPGSGLGFRQP
jgi:hypothetical protein